MTRTPEQRATKIANDFFDDDDPAPWDLLRDNIAAAIREAVDEVENEYGPMVNDLEMQLESSQKQLAFLNRRYVTEHQPS